MGLIKVLDDQLINRIAAGEVIERPSSVVKELVENSLDAGADSVEIRLEAGGKRFIKVADNGSGMDRDDALLALERHATSKLTGGSDLTAISTLGFRGEALPSIAAVSRLRLATSTSDGFGTGLEVKGGRIISVKDAGLPEGTSIEVDRLFFNMPVRRKFLRTEGTELAHALRFVTRQALARPDVRFVLVHGQRRLIEAVPTASRTERVSQLLGSSTAESMVPFDTGPAGLRVHGFAGRPAGAGPRKDRQHIFVNGRSVSDRVISHAVSEAYGNTVPPGRHPALILFVDLEHHLVDVNVHPQKNEVRFINGRHVHQAVVAALRQAVGAESAIPSYSYLRPDSDVGRTSYPVERPLGGAETLSGASETIGERAASYPDIPFPLCQFENSYIIASDASGLVIVDQHAAHERIMFERFRRQADEGKVEVQKMMFPLTIDMAPHEYAVLEKEAEDFRRLGFHFEPFGDKTIRLDAIPAAAGNVDPVLFMHELLGSASKTSSPESGIDSLKYKLVVTAACKAAIKINHTLNIESMRALLVDLYATEQPTTCPHGRPVLFRLTREEILRAFRRS